MTYHINNNVPVFVFAQGVQIMNPQELKSILSHGLLSFPVTDFNAQGDFNQAGYIKRLEWLAPYGFAPNWSLVVSPNPRCRQESRIFSERVRAKEWQRIWPDLVVNWP